VVRTSEYGFGGVPILFLPSVILFLFFERSWVFLKQTLTGWPIADPATASTNDVQEKKSLESAETSIFLTGVVTVSDLLVSPLQDSSSAAKLEEHLQLTDDQTARARQAMLSSDLRHSNPHFHYLSLLS